MHSTSFSVYNISGVPSKTLEQNRGAFCKWYYLRLVIHRKTLFTISKDFLKDFQIANHQWIDLWNTRVDWYHAQICLSLQFIDLAYLRLRNGCVRTVRSFKYFASQFLERSQVNICFLLPCANTELHCFVLFSLFCFWDECCSRLSWPRARRLQHHILKI